MSDQSESKEVGDVILVEDDVALADTMLSYLEKRGLTVRAVHTGSAAFSMLEKHEPRVAVVDYRLPDLTGLDVAFRLRGLLPALPIILMSGVLEGLERESLDKGGIKVFVNKPLSLKALHHAVSQFIED